MAKDEEERAEAREVEKDEKVMYHCDQSPVWEELCIHA